MGDSLAADVAGGAAAGLRTVWITGCGPQEGTGRPDHTVGDILDAFTLIAAGATASG